MRDPVWYLSVLAGAVCGGLVGLPLTLVLFLLVGETAAYFVSAGVNGLMGALGSYWYGNAFEPDRGVGRLLIIVGVSQVAAAVVSIVILYLRTPDRMLSEAALGGPVFAGSLVVTLMVSVAAWGVRKPVTDGREDLWVTAALLGLAGVGVTGAIIVQGILSPVPY